MVRVDGGVTTMYNQQVLPLHDLGDANAGVYMIHGGVNEYIDYPELRPDV